ncbi:hypothetical protein CEQ21_24710 [Niallia circulans]|uniref:Uncharacterized protein n=1 Tax=Niallia circulans TaxID=1397 RepID=A0A553SNN9_NIACI|nr:hypothetical protein [Niallia circulans]TRZ38587.1 hypothetical protein CEQ21_24710 [Niallia circulans]
MTVISLFEHSLKLELAISELENNHIGRECILAKPIFPEKTEYSFIDPYNNNGMNLFLVSCISMIMMLLGTIYGFVLYLGPIIWGLIGMIAGALVGIFLDVSIKKSKRNKPACSPAEVLLIINCEEDKANMVEMILKKYHTLGIVRL